MEKEIIRLDDTGRGICYVDEKVTFVPKTVVGDLIELEIIKSKKNYNEGILLNVINPSSKRIKPKCPYFDICGGCDLQNIPYQETVDYKKEKVKNLFARNGFSIDPIFISNEQDFNYRNKVTLSVENKIVGYKEAKSHKIIAIDECVIAENCINKVIPLIKEFGITSGKVIIRCNQNEEILLIINSNDEINIDVKKLKSVCKLCGIVLNDKTYYGENFLYERLNDIIYRISYDSFFQVNPYIASKLFDIVNENINESDQVVDLYSGVGTLSLNAAKVSESVIGVEIIPNAVLNSIFNAKINKLENAKFVLNDATDAILKINDSFNKLIVDPPRSGLTKEIINVILKSKPDGIIYVSCDMHTLVRDLKLLKNNYQIKKLYTLDMFSYTYHVENICILEKI